MRLPKSRVDLHGIEDVGVARQRASLTWIFAGHGSGNRPTGSSDPDLRDHERRECSESGVALALYVPSGLQVVGRLRALHSSCGTGIRVGTWPPGTPTSMVLSRLYRRASIHRVPCSHISECHRSYSSSPLRSASDMPFHVPDEIAGSLPEFVRMKLMSLSAAP